MTEDTRKDLEKSIANIIPTISSLDSWDSLNRVQKTNLVNEVVRDSMRSLAEHGETNLKGTLEYLIEFRGILN